MNWKQTHTHIWPSGGPYHRSLAISPRSAIQASEQLEPGFSDLASSALPTEPWLLFMVLAARWSTTIGLLSATGFQIWPLFSRQRRQKNKLISPSGPLQTWDALHYIICMKNLYPLCHAQQHKCIVQKHGWRHWEGMWGTCTPWFEILGGMSPQKKWF